MSGRRLPILAWLLLIGLCTGFIAMALKVNTDLGAFLPAHTDSEHALLLSELQQGRAADVLLLALEGGTASMRAAYSERLAQRLRQAPEVGVVYNSARALDEATEALLFRYRYLIAPDLDLDETALRAQLQTRLEELSAPLPTLNRRQLGADPTATYLRVLSAARPAVQPYQAHGVWFSPDEERALLLVELSGRGLDVNAQRTSVAAIEAAYADLAVPPELSLLVSGPARFAAQAASTIEREAQLFTVLGSALLMGFLLLVYRSGRIVLLSAAPLATALLVGTAAVLLVFGSIHGIALAFGITILGVAIDYPLHLFSQQRATPGPQALRRMWPTLRLSVATTLVGYLSLALTDFTGLAQLGLLASVGLVAAALVTRWVLPALLPAVVPGAAPGHGGPAWLQRVPQARWVVPSVTVVIPAAFLALVMIGERDIWERDLAALSPIPAAERALDRDLRLQLGAPEPGQLILVRAPSAQQALTRSEAVLPLLDTYRREGLLTDYEAAARYLPSIERQRERAQRLPDDGALQARLAAAQEGMPFRAQAFASFLTDVAAARDLTPLTPAGLSSTALGARLQGQLYETDHEWWAVILLIGVHDPLGLGAQFQAAGLAGVHYLDLRAAGAQLVDEFRAEALTRLGWGALAMMALLTAGLRSPRAALWVAAPVALASLASVTLLVALGQTLSLFHVIALLLVVGIGLDYSLFFRRWRALGTEGRATLHALVVCVASTLGVFGILSLSQVPVLNAIGRTVTIGVAFSFVLSYYFAAQARPVTMQARGQDGHQQDQEAR